MLKLPYLRRRNSCFNRPVPCPLTSKIKHPSVAPKILSFSKNYDDFSTAEAEKNFQNENISEHQSFQSKIFDQEPVVDNEIPNVIYLNQNRHVLKEEIEISPIPKLCSPNQSAFSKIFKEKIKLCNYIFDFTKPRFQLNGKQAKYTALVEINTLLSNKFEASQLTSEQQDLILQMIIKNIFDQDPFISKKKSSCIIPDFSYVESSWEQLSIIHKILQQFVLLFPEKVDISLCKKSIYLMNTPDANERDCFVTFLKNYEKTHKKKFDTIWHFLKTALTNVRYDIYTPYCVEPIISYMTILFFENISTEYSKYFTEILYTHLLPLFDKELLTIYYQKLSHFIQKIVDNDYEEQINVILFLIRHFPYMCGNKQPLFVSSIISIVEMMQWEQLSMIAEKIFVFVAMGVKSPNSKLAESVLNLLMKNNMKPIIFSNYEHAMDILYEPLKWTSAFYWNKFVKEQSSNALNTLISANVQFQKNKSVSDFLLCSELPTESCNGSLFVKKNCKRDAKEMMSIWASISRAAARNHRSIDLTKSLYKIQIEFKNEEKNEIPVIVNDKNNLNNKSASKLKDDNTVKVNLKIRNFKSNFT